MWDGAQKGVGLKTRLLKLVVEQDLLRQREMGRALLVGHRLAVVPNAEELHHPILFRLKLKGEWLEA